MSTARCYLDPIRKPPEPAHRDRTRWPKHSSSTAGAAPASATRSVATRARRARRARSSSAAARSTRRSCSNCRASASPSGCAISGSRCAMRCPASARTCATTTRRGRAGWSARRASPTTTGPAVSAWCDRRCATRCSASGMLGERRRRRCAPSCARARGSRRPDLLLGWVPMLTEPGPKGPQISRQSGITCYAHPMRPESKGHIHIISADPQRPPAINFNFLSSPLDAELTVTRDPHRARGHDTRRRWRRLQVTEIAPGAGRTTDDEIIDWVKQRGRDDLPPGRHLQDGVGPDGGRRCRASRARDRRACASPMPRSCRR